MAGPPSGEQFEIALGNQRATVVEVGGGIREYFVGDRPVLDPYPIDAMCDGGRGAPLIPWPNRLADGRYRFDGIEYRLPLSEPDKRNAIHGLLRWRSWRLLDRSLDRVIVGTTLRPRSGYPFDLDIRMEYSLGDEGLVVATTAANLGERPCPYGFGQHPYLSAGGGLLDECVLELGAETRILTDEERQLPIGTEPVEGTPYDFRVAAPIGHRVLDAPYAGLARDGEGRAWVQLTAPDGSRVELWADRSHPIIQLFTGDTLAPDRRRRGLAAEPMTCPPNAFNTGDGVIGLDPGHSVTTRWGVRLA
jgi:aldose 1-epimerase